MSHLSCYCRTKHTFLFNIQKRPQKLQYMVCTKQVFTCIVNSETRVKWGNKIKPYLKNVKIFKWNLIQLLSDNSVIIWIICIHIRISISAVFISVIWISISIWTSCFSSKGRGNNPLVLFFCVVFHWRSIRPCFMRYILYVYRNLK